MNYLIATTGTRDLCFDKKALEENEFTELIEIKKDEKRSLEVKIKLDNEEEIDIPVWKSKDGSFQNFLYFSNSRESGKKLAKPEIIDKIIDTLCMPIIMPSIDYILNQGIPENELKIYFVLTDNPESVPMKFRANDTVNLFQLYQRITLNKLKKLQSGNVKKFAVKMEPTRIDEVYQFFSENSSLFNFKSENMFYHAQGGVDGLNNGLLIKLLENYPHLKYLYKGENDRNSYLLHFPQQFLNNIEREKLISAAENTDYAYLIARTKENQKENFLAKIGEAFMNLDFDGAQEIISQGMAIPEVRNELRKYQTVSDELKNTIQGQLSLIFQTAEIKFITGAYGDYLWRIFLIKENVLKPFLEEFFDEKIEYDLKNKHQSWNNILNKNTEIIDYLKEVKVGNFKLNYREPNAMTFEKIVEFLEDKDKIKLPDNWKALWVSINKLSELRNKVAHEMKGVSLELINDKLQNNIDVESLNQEIKDFIRQDEYTDNIFKNLNEEIINSL